MATGTLDGHRKRTEGRNNRPSVRSQKSLAGPLDSSQTASELMIDDAWRGTIEFWFEVKGATFQIVIRRRSQSNWRGQG